MNNKSVLFYKTLVIGMIILFTGVAVQPGIATLHPKEEIDVEPRDYLFQTIIKIARNLDVKELFKQYNYQILPSDFDYTDVFLQMLFKHIRLFFNMLFTKSSVTYDYLDKCYNNGIEICNILGEDKALKMVKPGEFINPEFFDELNNIILEDEELSDRIAILEEMNKELKPDTSWGFPIICGILEPIMNLLANICYQLGTLIGLYKDNPIIFNILWIIFFPIATITYLIDNIGVRFGCWEY